MTSNLNTTESYAEQLFQPSYLPQLLSQAFAYFGSLSRSRTPLPWSEGLCKSCSGAETLYGTFTYCRWESSKAGQSSMDFVLQHNTNCQPSLIWKLGKRRVTTGKKEDPWRASPAGHFFRPFNISVVDGLKARGQLEVFSVNVNCVAYHLLSVKMYSQ